MLKIIFSIFLLTSLSTKADIVFKQSMDPIDKFLDEGPETYVDSLFREVDIVDTHYKEGNDNFVPLKEKKEKLNLEKLPTKYKAVLKDGSALTSLKTGRELYLTKDIYVIARQKFYGGQYSYIFNKKGKIVYKTLTRNLTSVEKDIIIHPQVDATYVNPKKTSHNTIDSSIGLDNNLSLGYTSFSSPQFLDTVGAEQANAAATQFSARTLIKSKLPLHFGIELQYLKGQATDSTNMAIADWNTLYFGPVIKYPFYKSGLWKMSTLLTVSRSLFFSMTTEDNSYEFSSTTWKLHFEVERKYQYGSLAMGLAYFNEKSSLKPQLAENINISSEKSSTNGISITIGYNFEFNI